MMIKQCIVSFTLLLCSSLSIAQEWISEEVLQQLSEIRQELKELKTQVQKLNQVIDGATQAKKNPLVGQSISLDHLPMKGDPSAKIAIVEFTDLECGFCRRHSLQTLPKIQEHYVKTNKLQYFAMQFPLSFHRNAKGASIAALCAEQQQKGAYWHYHQGLFNKTIAFNQTAYREAAKALQLEQNQYAACLDSQAMATLIDQQSAVGSSLGVSGTPAFFIGRIKENQLVDLRLISGAQPYQNFQSIIDGYLN